jgi:hypothetical protein
VDNSFHYIFIYRFSYLLTYYYSFLAHYNKKCFDINWFHLLSPAILSLCYSRTEVTWLLRDDSNSKTRVRFVYMKNLKTCFVFQWQIYVKWVPLVLYFSDKFMFNECHLFYFSVINLCSMSATCCIFQWQIYVKWVPLILYFNDRFMLNECHLFYISVTDLC